MHFGKNRTGPGRVTLRTLARRMWKTDVGIAYELRHRGPRRYIREITRASRQVVAGQLRAQNGLTTPERMVAEAERRQARTAALDAQRAEANEAYRLRQEAEAEEAA